MEMSWASPKMSYVPLTYTLFAYYGRSETLSDVNVYQEEPAKTFPRKSDGNEFVYKRKHTPTNSIL